MKITKPDQPAVDSGRALSCNSNGSQIKTSEPSLDNKLMEPILKSENSSSHKNNSSHVIKTIAANKRNKENKAQGSNEDVNSNQNVNSDETVHVIKGDEKLKESISQKEERDIISSATNEIKGHDIDKVNRNSNTIRKRQRTNELEWFLANEY